MNELKVDWPIFFEPEDRVMALPCWQHPRFFVVSRNARQRWRDSAFYPAFKYRARLFRYVVRGAAALGVLSVKRGGASGLRDVRKTVAFDRAAVLVGVEGSTQKLIARCIDSNGDPVAYIKYSNKPKAVKHIRDEASVLRRLTEEKRINPCLAPVVYWEGAVGEGHAVAVSAVEGKMLNARLPAANKSSALQPVTEFLHQFELSAETKAIDEHPVIVRMRNALSLESCNLSDGEFDKLLDPLRSRLWPVVIQHGDFTPWNVVCRADGSGALTAIDWEEGTTEGFPYFDLVYFILQTGILIHRYDPQTVAHYAVGMLEQNNLTEQQAWALVRLTALDAVVRFASRTGDKAKQLQDARMAIIQMEPNP
jgi:hypothetical protein